MHQLGATWTVRYAHIWQVSSEGFRSAQNMATTWNYFHSSLNSLDRQFSAVRVTLEQGGKTGLHSVMLIAQSQPSWTKRGGPRRIERQRGEEERDGKPFKIIHFKQQSRLMHWWQCLAPGSDCYFCKINPRWIERTIAVLLFILPPQGMCSILAKGQGDFLLFSHLQIASLPTKSMGPTGFIWIARSRGQMSFCG